MLRRKKTPHFLSMMRVPFCLNPPVIMVITLVRVVIHVRHGHLRHDHVDRSVPTAPAIRP
jgi:hypothetical protein